MTLTRASNISLSARLRWGTAKQNGLISSVVCLYGCWMKLANGAEIIARSTLLPKHPGKWGAWSLPTEPSVMKNQLNKAALTGPSAVPREMEQIVLCTKFLIVCGCTGPSDMRITPSDPSTDQPHTQHELHVMLHWTELKCEESYTPDHRTALRKYNAEIVLLFKKWRTALNHNPLQQGNCVKT